MTDTPTKTDLLPDEERSHLADFLNSKCDTRGVDLWWVIGAIEDAGYRLYQASQKGAVEDQIADEYERIMALPRTEANRVSGADAVPIITERGFAGHFICSHRCTFTRNTLIDFGDRMIVVSTVGNMLEKDGSTRDTIGVNRYYETMAFEGILQDGYWEADIGKQLSFESEWSISEIEHMSDDKADKMHDAVVKELSRARLADQKEG